MDTITVQYKQDPKTHWWTATVPAEPSVVSQGKTLAQVHDRVRKAIALVRGDSGPLALKGETDWSNRDDLSKDVVPLVKEEGDLRISMLEIKAELERTTAVAVQNLIFEKGYSYRQTSRLLGITHQRVEQIAKRIQTHVKTYADEGSSQ